MNIDKVILPLLFDSDAEVVQLAELIVKLDKNSHAEPHVCLANVLECRNENLEMVNVLREQSSRFLHIVFEERLKLLGDEPMDRETINCILAMVSKLWILLS
jgi:hypothetical protein